MTLFVQAGEVQHLHGALLGLFFALCTGVAEVGGGGDVIQNAQVLQRFHDLEGAGDLHVGVLIRLFVGDVLTIVEDLAFGGRVVAADHVEGGGFTSTVGADHAGDGAFLHRERNIMHGGQTLEPLGLQ